MHAQLGPMRVRLRKIAYCTDAPQEAAAAHYAPGKLLSG